MAGIDINETRWSIAGVTASETFHASSSTYGSLFEALIERYANESYRPTTSPDSPSRKCRLWAKML